jgi:uncharacterized cofD-like protein
MKSELNVVVIGGGTGLSILLRGLKYKYKNITAIVTVADDGGGSGILREDLGMLPPGDIRSCIIALANTEPTMEKLLQYRFEEGRLKGQSFGNLFIAAMDGISKNFEYAIKKISDILAVTGKVLPVSNEDVHLVAYLENGKVFNGESNIPMRVKEENSRIKRVGYNKKDVRSVTEVPISIMDADIILIGPGSLYTSIIPSLIIEDVNKALKNTNAKIAFVTNLMTQPGETDGYSIAEHVQAAIDHIGENVFDYVIANKGSIDQESLERYSKDGSEFLKMNKKDIEYFSEKKIKRIEGNFIEVVKGYVRHNSLVIADVIEKLVDIKIYR